MKGESKQCLWCEKTFFRGNTQSQDWATRKYCDQRCNAKHREEKARINREAKAPKVKSNSATILDNWLYGYRP